MSDKEYAIGDAVNVLVPESFQPYANNLTNAIGKIDDIVEIGDDWVIYYFNANGLECFLEESLEDGDWVSYFGVKIEDIEDESEFVDDNDDYKTSITINGESYNYVEEDEEVDYYYASEDEEDVFDYVEYQHSSADRYLRISYWDEDFEAYLYVEVDF